MAWNYTTIVVPRITYNSIIWNRTQQETDRYLLDRVQERFLREITIARRSTLTAAMRFMLRPLALYIRENSMKAVYRLNCVGSWKSIGSRRRILLDGMKRWLLTKLHWHRQISRYRSREVQKPNPGKREMKDEVWIQTR